jgi:hypothetical protein
MVRDTTTAASGHWVPRSHRTSHDRIDTPDTAQDGGVPLFELRQPLAAVRVDALVPIYCRKVWSLPVPMRTDIAIVRQHVERISGVERTWFEWSLEDEELVKILVVEVNFDTDPNSHEFRKNVIDAIEDTFTTVLAQETTMVVSHLRIIPTGTR